MDTVDDILAHYGVKGMKWGVRKDRLPQGVTTKSRPGKKVKTSGGRHHSPSKDAKRAARLRQQARKSTTDSLSNNELKDLINRMNLEAQYNNLSRDQVNVGARFVRGLIGKPAKATTLADYAINEASSKDFRDKVRNEIQKNRK